MKPYVLLLSKKDKSELKAFMKKTRDKEEVMGSLIPMTAQTAVNRYKQRWISGLKTKLATVLCPSRDLIWDRLFKA